MATNNITADVHVLSKQRLKENSATNNRHVQIAAVYINSSDKMQIFVVRRKQIFVLRFKKLCAESVMDLGLSGPEARLNMLVLL